MSRYLNLTDARNEGHMYYLSGNPCKKGHTSKRLVSTQQCCKCLHDRKISQRSGDSAIKKKTAMIKRMVAGNLGLKHYNTGMPCKNGHLSDRLVSTRQCIECLKLRPKSTRSKPSIIARKRINSRRRRPQAKLKQREYQSKVLFSRPEYKIRVFMRGCISRLMSRKDGRRSASVLGYSRFDLMKRIEFNFKDGMNWGNYGEWHIDHKKPIIRFLSQGVSDPKVINALSNLQPLWAKDNISKGCKF